MYTLTIERREGNKSCVLYKTKCRTKPTNDEILKIGKDIGAECTDIVRLEWKSNAKK